MSEYVKGVLALLTLAVLFGALVACPGQCICKWKNGKQTVECNERNLHSIPDGMDPGTQVLEFNGNSLYELHSEIFLKMELINLQRLYMSRCSIHSIDDQTFKGLTNLVELDLSSNLLETVPTVAFMDCPSLMRLTLNSNPIKILKRAAFTQLSFLNTLELSNCNIAEMDSEAFYSLHNLEWLRLDGNQLKNIRGKSALPDNLRGIELHGNPWECDCHLQDLRTWLEMFSISLSTEPVCNGPSRLARRPVKSITPVELACLPEVFPTTLYLEIAEGKNVSLSCNVHAIPEAQVSWFFQGQLIQNDSLISPGLRILYFIEEGSENKKSELFIYNVNTEDNGTFICSAENSAGSVSSNFTIRIIVKEEPLITYKPFKIEFLFAGIVGAVSLFMLFIIILICVIVCRHRKRQNQSRDKNVNNDCDKNINISKMGSDNEVEPLSDFLKLSMHDHPQEVVFFSPPLNRNLFQTLSPITIAEQMRSPVSLRPYQIEQNPDLINDAESVSRRKDGDGEDDHDSIVTQVEQTIIHPTAIQFPLSHMRANRQLYSIHSWDVGYSMDSEGYPPDYGLPKVQNAAQNNENFYRTLPYNRAARRQSAANPLSRYSREAEFLSGSSQPAPYEHYCADVRYTANGYPARPGETGIVLIQPPSEDPNAETNTACSLPCTSGMTVQWAPCVTAALQTMKTNLETNQSKYANVTKRCVGAQTESPASLTDKPNDKTESSQVKENDQQHEMQTESPDEGYEGEPAIAH